MKRPGAAAAMAACLLAGAALSADPVPEPLGYRMEGYRAPVPATIEGGEVVGTAQARALLEAGETLFIDVLPRPPKPEGLPEGTIWRDKPRRTIPGAVWLPDIGYGAISPETDAYFRENLARLTGSRDTPVLFFCLAECWMSWNAARRAIWEYGYTRVYWYPDGTDGWSAAGFPLERSAPVPR